MKIAKIGRDDHWAWGAVSGDVVDVLGDWSSPTGLTDIFTLTTAELQALAAKSQEQVKLNDVTLAPPIPLTAKIICVGLNYKSHADEAGLAAGDFPAAFIKTHDVLVGHGQNIERPIECERYDYEGEIVVVMGQAGRHIALDKALGHVFGYTIMNDGSLRNYDQRLVSASKNFWHSGSLGPWITTADEIVDPTTLQLETRVNDNVVQSASAAKMVHDIPACIETISKWTRLLPGDIIATGTPEGIGAAKDPPLWLKAGDRLSISVSNIGTLENQVVDEVHG